MMFATWVLEVNQLSQEFMDPNLVKAKLIITSGKGQVLAAGTAEISNRCIGNRQVFRVWASFSWSFLPGSAGWKEREHG
ncbi:uncharacterized protein LOC110889281 isoform X2 [Helianthus annuus]|uniref:uncharacterized protein LOC110889281 isoform X2 n=1 Tax=Helianthus annuus TaxID=4232 RepID=UPI000B908CE2|nr:uncharacterized protein LOC110889281 isoform X2 [Helianthus annuus]